MTIKKETNTDAKEVPLTGDQKIELLVRDVQELARGVNKQAALLESVVLACDAVVKKYIELTKVVKAGENEEKKA
jgi:hypothetical protein